MNKHRLAFLAAIVAGSALLAPKAPASAQTNTETGRLYSFIDEIIYNSWGIHYNIGPEETTRDKWPDYSDDCLSRLNDLFQYALTALAGDFTYEALDYQGKLTYRIFDRYAKQETLFYEYRLNSYAIDQWNGAHTRLPSNLINYHGIDTYTDAAAYITKLDKIGDVFDQVIDNCERRKLFGCIPPQCIFPAMLETAGNMIEGYPIESESGEFNALYADFKRKVDAAPIPPAQKDSLMVQVESVLIDDVKPAYEDLISYLEELEVLAPTHIGVGSMPNGDAYYRMMLEHRTSTDLTPGQIHKLGKQNVRRIRREMKRIMSQINFPGRRLRDFFDFFRTDPRFTLQNNKHGRKKYLKQANLYIEEIWDKADEMFTVFPLSGLIIKPVEPYREKTTLRAWYAPGSADGSRPGAYYLNLYDMNDQPLYDLEALSHHEGIPGHHFQVSLAQEKDYGTYLRPEGSGSTAYIEGWALYTEKMTGEFGFYQDPYSDFGRLSMEMLRACRLVVDSGIHYKNWSRQRAIDYIMKNTPETLDNVTAEVDRYAVMAAQATSYMIGKLKIEETREAAEQKLGPRFDIRAFHDELLTHGPLPLYLLEDVMEDWSDSVLSGAALHARPSVMLPPQEVPQWVTELRRIKKDGWN